MAQGNRRRSHRSSGAAAGLTGPATASCLHSVETHPPTRHESASIWNRRRVLLLNSTYEPLTALPMRRAIVMVICGKADVVHHDLTGPVIHSATSSIVVPSVIQLRTYVRVPYRARVPMTRAALMRRAGLIVRVLRDVDPPPDHAVRLVHDRLPVRVPPPWRHLRLTVKIRYHNAK